MAMIEIDGAIIAKANLWRDSKLGQSWLPLVFGFRVDLTQSRLLIHHEILRDGSLFHRVGKNDVKNRTFLIRSSQEATPPNLH